MALAVKNIGLVQRQAIIGAFALKYSLFVKAEREAKKIAEDIADDPFLTIDEIEHRIKKEDSYLAKCEEKGLSTPEEAEKEIRDVVGIRLITRYLDKIPLIIERIKKHPLLVFVEDKNYLTPPKPNGYRGFHVIMQLTIENQLIYVEFQVRTMAQHLWASFEHILRYKNPSLEISEEKNRVFRIVSDKLYEVDLMIMKLRDDCEPDKVVADKSFLNDKLFTLMTEASLVTANAEASESTPIPKNAKGAPAKDFQINASGKPLNVHRKKKAGKKKKKHH